MHINNYLLLNLTITHNYNELLITFMIINYIHELCQLSKGRLKLDDFRAPSTCYLEPVSENEFRHSIAEGGSPTFFIENKETGERRTILPSDVRIVRMLILGLDEGSIGAAGVAFSSFHLKHTVWARFDKRHKLIRDMKLAEADCCGKLFVKAKLWSNYSMLLDNYASPPSCSCKLSPRNSNLRKHSL